MITHQCLVALVLALVLVSSTDAFYRGKRNSYEDGWYRPYYYDPYRRWSRERSEYFYVNGNYVRGNMYNYYSYPTYPYYHTNHFDQRSYNNYYYGNGEYYNMYYGKNHPDRPQPERDKLLEETNKRLEQLTDTVNRLTQTVDKLTAHIAKPPAKRRGAHRRWHM